MHRAHGPQKHTYMSRWGRGGGLQGEGGGGTQGFDLLHVSSRGMNPRDPGPRQIMQEPDPILSWGSPFLGFPGDSPGAYCKGRKLDSMNHNVFCVCIWSWMNSAPGWGGRRRKEGFLEPGLDMVPQREPCLLWNRVRKTRDSEFSGRSKYPHKKLEDQEMLLPGKVVPRFLEQQLTPSLYLLFSHLWISISSVK